MSNENANKENTDSVLNSLIAGEIKNDEFYTAIKKIASEENIKTVLEIGSSSGEGSTEAFVIGLQENPNKPVLFCMEISKPRFDKLQQTYANYHWVKCYNVSSVSIEQFPDKNQVIAFYNTKKTGLNHYPLETVLSWLREDIEYVKHAGVECNGIKKIKQENNIIYFDLVLIDGSEFTGSSELEEVYGAKFILLDDINTFKNYTNYYKLLSDQNYTLISYNYSLRNGYAIFKKLSFSFDSEQREQLLVQRLVRPGMTVFDIGANVGNYTILFGELVGNSGKVYAFEPTSSTFKKLQERLDQLGSTNIHLFQKAVYSENTQIEFNEFPENYSVWNSIGKPQMLNPADLREYVPIVQTEIVEAIKLDSFCEQHNIHFIDYLKLDVEGAESDALCGIFSLLEKKAIQFIQFEISQKMLDGLNRKAQDTFEILIQNGYECHRIQGNGEIGEQVIDSDAFYENYLAFPSFPVHFFTIVLNGEPFIRYHIEVFKQLPFKWHWHIVEGVADLKHDTAWSLKLGGRISDEIHRNGRSHDGTSVYLDELAQQYPENITIYRHPEGVFWEGKREMVNAPLANINEECLLWQVDVDELWTSEQICRTRQMFINNPDKTAAFYWCWYFVGENLVISTRNCYAQNPAQDWLRTWRFKPGFVWAAHEPPILAEPLPDGKFRNVASLNPFVHEETEKQGLVFQHFAYVTPEQLNFKEQYYGYANAVSQWQALQKQAKFPVLLRQYFPWVNDATMVDTAKLCGVVPIARKDHNRNVWQFVQPNESQSQTLVTRRKSPTILIDGVFFQLYQTGIARVWRSLLEEWANDGFTKHIIVLDRMGTAPEISGINYRLVPPYDYNKTDADREMLQQVCDEEGADLFISTYYTTPLSTPSVFMAYDMIPELLGADFNEPMWREKHFGLRHASAYISISENTARDLVKLFPDIAPESVTVAHCGVQPIFSPATSDEMSRFRTKYAISKPYFIAVGISGGYKNSILFFQAFAQLYSRHGFEIVCTGSGGLLPPEFRTYTSGVVVHMLQLSDDELKAAYSGAVALVYPSKYEGFGLPVLEAMSCGCPVITCPNASIPEVAGKAVMYVSDEDVNGVANALCDVQKPEIRNSLISAGFVQSKTFSWSAMAKKVSSALIEATLLRLKLKAINLIVFPDWLQPEESLTLEIEQVLKATVTHPNKTHITLLIDTSKISEEDANLILSSVTMNILMQEDLDVEAGPEISLIDLDEVQWEALLPRLHARIRLENENQQSLATAKAEKLPYYEVNRLSQTNFLS